MRIKIIPLYPILFLIACAHLKEARQFYNNREYEKAISLCRKAIDKDTTDIEARLFMSRIYLAMDSTDQSLDILSRFHASDNLSRLQKKQMIRQYLVHSRKTRNTDRSTALLIQAEQLDSMHVNLLDTLAALFYNQGKFEEAKIRYNRLIDISRDPLPYMSRINAIENRQTFTIDEFEKGMEALKAGKRRKAEEHLKKAAETNPHFADAVYEYGMLAGKRLYKEGTQETLDKAVSVLRQAVKMKPRDIEVHYLLAKVCDRKGQGTLEEAINHYQKVIRLASDGKYVKNCQKRIRVLKKRKAFWEKGQKQTRQ
ncbi:tetratricopeptide repeat protein [bacterium]|nr:tetratricopeptide repeat protein [bacterium]